MMMGGLGGFDFARDSQEKSLLEWQGNDEY